MRKNKSISLGTHIENLITSSVSSEKNNSTSEVTRSVLRLLESDEKKIDELRDALIEGEKSPVLDNFDRDRHLADLHRKYL
jgi:antitoxin ParD1/3/4